MSNRIDNISIPDSDAACQSWKLYYDKLVKKYGKSNAREAWLYTFNQKGNSSCTKDKTFNQWAAKNQIAVADNMDKAVAGMSGIGQNIIGGIGSITNLVPKLTAVALIGTVGIALFIAYRFSREVKPTDVIGALPIGKVGKLSKALNQ